MFREKMIQMLKLDTPAAPSAKTSIVPEASENLLNDKSVKSSEDPDFSKLFNKKDLTKDDEHATLSDLDKAEMHALKILIAKYKSEK